MISLQFAFLFECSILLIIDLFFALFFENGGEYIT